MNIILLFGVLLIAVSLLEIKKLPPYWGFLVVFVIMGFQEGVEGDFMGYKFEYENISRIASYYNTIKTEPLWYIIISLFSSIVPFWAFVMILSGFECLVLWKLSKEFGSIKYSYLAPILFFFTFYLMLIQMKALRQGLAVEICILAYLMSYAKKGWILSTTFAIAAVLVHNSALLAWPFILVQVLMVSNKSKKREIVYKNIESHMEFPIIMTAIFLLVYSLKKYMLVDWLNAAAEFTLDEGLRLSEYFEKEQGEIFDISWLIIFYNAVMVFLCSWFYQSSDWRYRVLAIGSIIGCYLDMLLFGVGSLPRLCMYYFVYNIVVYPKITEMIAQKYGKTVAFAIMVLMVGYAVKSSLPMILATDDVIAFGTYRFVFM